MSRYRGNSYDRIYKAANRSILNNGQRPPDHQVRACLSKVGYDTEFEAQVMAAKRRLHVYKCPYCPHYHLTSQAP